jgi:hypothetical protein
VRHRLGQHGCTRGGTLAFLAGSPPGDTNTPSGCFGVPPAVARQLHSLSLSLSLSLSAGCSSTLGVGRGDGGATYSLGWFWWKKNSGSSLMTNVMMARNKQ